MRQDERIPDRTAWLLIVGTLLGLIGFTWWLGGAEGLFMLVLVTLGGLAPMALWAAPALLLLPVIAVAALFPAGRAWICDLVNSLSSDRTDTLD